MHLDTYLFFGLGHISLSFNWPTARKGQIVSFERSLTFNDCLHWEL